MERTAYVYFMASSNNNVLYTGVTTNLPLRIWQHKNISNPDSFTAKYNCHKLVYVEYTSSIRAAIVREKQLKSWKREWKNSLIEEVNPNWMDMSDDWLDSGSSPE